jgi:hypothetical protein
MERWLEPKRYPQRKGPQGPQGQSPQSLGPATVHNPNDLILGKRGARGCAKVADSIFVNVGRHRCRGATLHSINKSTYGTLVLEGSSDMST